MSAGRLACGAAALLLAAGCAYRPAAAPESTLQAPTTWRTGAAQTATIGAQWWKNFGDPVLDSLVETALAGNTDLRVARSRVQEYQSRVQVANAGQYPSVTAGLNPGRARAINAFGVATDVTTYRGSLQATYEVDLWGRVDSLIEAARADYEAQQAAADAAALVVAANVTSGYLNLRGLDSQLDLARDTLKSRQESLDLATRQFATGYSSRLELVQAQAEYRSTAGSIPQLQRSIAQQENALSMLMGANPGPVARGLPLAQLQVPVVAPGLPSELLRRRPDIFQAERAIVAADANLAVARDQLLPSVQLTASAGVAAFSLNRFLDSPIGLWSIGGSILGPIIDGGRLRAQTDVAATVRDRAVFAYESTVRGAFMETDNGLEAVQRLEEQATQARERQVAAAEALRIAHNRYRNGYASYLEELDAQRTRYSADVSLLQLRTSLLAAHVDLYRALGGGWGASGG